MTTNHFGNDDRGENKSSTPLGDAGGSSRDAIGLFAALRVAIASAQRLALECEEALSGSNSSPEPAETLHGAPAAISLIREAAALFREYEAQHRAYLSANYVERTLDAHGKSTVAKADRNREMADKLEAWLMDHEPDTVPQAEEAPGYHRRAPDIEPMGHRCETCGTKDGHEPGCAENVPPDEWGAPIAVDGKRPDWLRDGEYPMIESVIYKWHETGPGKSHVSNLQWNWPIIRAIRLPASHPYYLATSRGFAYWPGGDAAPADWDGGFVLARDDKVMNGTNAVVLCWQHPNTVARESVDIIGYRRKPDPDGCTCGNDGTAMHDLSCPCTLDDVEVTTEAVREAIDEAVESGAIRDLGGIGAARPNPRAPLMAEVEQLLREVGTRMVYCSLGKTNPEAGFATFKRVEAMLKALSALLIAQDKRLFEARTYDDVARAQAIRAAGRIGAEVDKEAWRNVPRVVDAVATALGLQRACNSAPS